MSRILHALALAALTLPASASVQPPRPDWSQAQHVEVILANFEFRPKTLTLKAGEPVVLDIRNRAEGGHDFTSREFFRAATIRSGDQQYVRDGSIEVPAGERRSIALVPAAGRYDLKCTHPFHHLMGMGGEIIVQ